VSYKNGGSPKNFGILAINPHVESELEVWPVTSSLTRGKERRSTASGRVDVFFFCKDKNGIQNPARIVSGKMMTRRSLMLSNLSSIQFQVRAKSPDTTSVQ
jgi:hypothetical protein